jgi:predicted acetyltransferase
MAHITIRPIRDDELVTWFETFGTAFYIWPTDANALAEARREMIELDRTLGAFDGDTMVGTFRSFDTPLTLPGGARVPTSAVTAVSVRPTHRRRGALNQMMVHDLRRAAAAGAAASILIASEWPIYGRFGFGPATWAARWTLRTRAAQFRVEPVGSIEIVDALTARKLLPDLYDAVATAQHGEIGRQDFRFDLDLGLKELPGRPRWKGSVAIHRDESGNPDGFARYHGEEAWEEGIPDNKLILDELRGVTLEAEIDLWRFLAEMDLTAMIQADTRREHEPLPWYLDEARAARSSKVNEFLWLRPLDVARLLGERRYERDGALVLEVADVLDGKAGPAAGRYRLEVRDGSAICARTDAAPDLAVEARALGAAILGGTRLVDASRVSGAEEHRAGALALADGLLWTADPPWCATWF